MYMLAHRRLIHDAEGADAPSSVSNSAVKFKNEEQSNHPIYNGRPTRKKGPPLSIYHEAFAILQDVLQNLDTLVDSQEEMRMDNTAKLCLAATAIYSTEADRIAAVQPFIESVLEIKRDGLALQGINDSDKKAEKAIVAHFEWKNELGLSGQCSLQNALSLRKRLIQSQYDQIRNTTCCPCITVSIAGPHISFGGAIFADIFVAEQFTDFIYLGGTKKRILTLPRIFAAVAGGIEILKQYYRTLELSPRSQPNLARLFPQPTYLPGHHIPSPTLAFSGRFEYKGQKTGDYYWSIFEATYNDTKVLVKFCESYHGQAHRTPAKAEHAPTLFFCEKLRGGMMMIVMEL
ncbi:hypothetical protein AX17_004027 [Amanita inopinata Kibby_2008]|nr:hypothetical protein AX17_004027 [Amanita inopinata Kibby_2008]